MVVRIDQEHSSSDGGAILLKARGEALDLTARLVDLRQEGKVEHTLPYIYWQLLCGPACGYEEVNDAARPTHDPSFKLLLKRDSLNVAALP
jgi:Transposase DDE domain group 1